MKQLIGLILLIPVLTIAAEPSNTNVPAAQDYTWGQVPLLGCPPDHSVVPKPTSRLRWTDEKGTWIHSYRLGGTRCNSGSAVGSIDVHWFPNAEWAKRYWRKMPYSSIFEDANMILNTNGDVAMARILADEKTLIDISLTATGNSTWATEEVKPMVMIDAVTHEKDEHKWFVWQKEPTIGLFNELRRYALGVVKGSSDHVGTAYRLRLDERTLTGDYVDFDENFRQLKPFGVRVFLEERDANGSWASTQADSLSVMLTLNDSSNYDLQNAYSWAPFKKDDTTKELYREKGWMDLRGRGNILSLEKLFPLLKDSRRGDARSLGNVRAYMTVELLETKPGSSEKNSLQVVEKDLVLSNVAQILQVFPSRTGQSITGGLEVGRASPQNESPYYRVHQLTRQQIETGAAKKALPLKLLPGDVVKLGPEIAARIRLLFDPPGTVWTLIGNEDVLKSNEQGTAWIYPSSTQRFATDARGDRRVSGPVSSKPRITISAGVTAAATTGGVMFPVIGVVGGIIAWVGDQIWSAEEVGLNQRKVTWVRAEIRSTIAIDARDDETRFYVVEGQATIEDLNGQSQTISTGQYLHLAGPQYFNVGSFDRATLPDSVRRAVSLLEIAGGDEPPTDGDSGQQHSQGTQADSGIGNSDVGCDKLVGKWDWFNGATVDCTEDRNCKGSNGAHGAWQCNAATKEYSIRWQPGSFVDRFKISDDGRLEGQNQNGMRISAKRYDAQTQTGVPGRVPDAATDAADRCKEILGIWSWFNGAMVECFAAGRCEASNGFGGPWECIGADGRFTIDWARPGQQVPYVDTLNLSTDGWELAGVNQSGQGVGGLRPGFRGGDPQGGCEAIIGSWRWSGGATVECRSDGTCTASNGLSGPWRCVSDKGRFEIRWGRGGRPNQFIDNLVVSPLGSYLSGKNQHGVGMGAVRAE